jgi:Immunoglobulin-like domain of bacterial spore germination/Sporulation and spore germination
MGLRRTTALVLLVLVLTGCGAERPQPPVPLGSSPTPQGGPPGPAESPSESEESQVALPVYYVAQTPAGFRLQREFHRVPSSDPPSDAVREMLAQPIGTDPDYHTPWPAGTALRSPVNTSGPEIVVDLTGLGAAQLAPDLAALAVQQLVFTVQGALQSTAPVRILVDGQQVEQLWGVDVSQPVRRGDAYALRSLVQIDAPAHGTTVEQEVEVTGEAAVFEATVRWEVLRDGAVIRSGFTSTTEGQRFAPFSFTVTLDPGEYTVRVMEDDPSNGEGRPPLIDDKVITVLGPAVTGTRPGPS